MPDKSAVGTVLSGRMSPKGALDKTTIDTACMLRTFFNRVNRVLSVLTDWLLILAGGLLVFKAVVAVDVPAARYVIISLGLLLSGFGLWYRYRRKRRDR